MSRTTIAIDNGTTGSIAIIGPDGVFFEPVPTREQLMGKAGKVVRRINWKELSSMIYARSGDKCSERYPADTYGYVERPFTGSAMMINTTVLSARAHEAVSIVLEQLGIGYETVDSKPWQAAMLGAIKGSPALKKASMLRGMQMYPALAATIKDHGDADSLLMAQYYHNLNK
jgi:hypothetical protein